MSMGIIGMSVAKAGSSIVGRTANVSGSCSAAKMSSLFMRYQKPPYFSLRPTGHLPRRSR